MEQGSVEEYKGHEMVLHVCEIAESNVEEKLNHPDVENNLELGLPPPTFTCRICLQEEKSADKLIYPCFCSGTSKYVHQECLNSWRELSTNPEAATKCLVCHAPYRIRPKQYHFFHHWCINIDFNTTLLFILQQFFTIILSIVIFIAKYEKSLRHDSRFNYEYEYMRLIERSYLISLVSTTCPLFLYTMYVFARYAEQKRKVCRKVCKRLSLSIPSLTVCVFMFILVPDIVMLMILLCVLLINHMTCLIFKFVEKTNRIHGRERIFNYEG